MPADKACAIAHNLYSAALKTGLVIQQLNVHLMKLFYDQCKRASFIKNTFQVYRFQMFWIWLQSQALLRQVTVANKQAV